VTNAATRKCNVYWGGPCENWVAQFVIDLANGLYGEPMRLGRASRPELDAA
jgi:hypothetical protein